MPGLITPTPVMRRVLSAITRAGGRPVIVGGTVRDAVLTQAGYPIRVSKDCDIEVYGVTDISSLEKELRTVGRVDRRGAFFAVLAVQVDGTDFDVSLPRQDSQSGLGHRAVVVDVDADLDEKTAFGRRDFTINALGFDPATGRLIDPYGGVSDLSAGILRHTTSSFVEDPLRVLRAVQFAGRFGFTLAQETQELCREMVPRYPKLSRERVWGEWRKLARTATHWVAAMTALQQTGWDSCFPELAGLQNVPQDPEWHPEGDVWAHAALSAEAAATSADRENLIAEDRELAVLSALLHDAGKATCTQVHRRSDGSVERITSRDHAQAGVVPAESFLVRIGAPRHLVERVLPLVAEHMAHVSTGPKPSRAAVRRLIRRLNPDGRGPSIHDWARVVDADCAGRASGAKVSPSPAWVALAQTVGVSPAKGLLRGEHLIQAGLQPGPLFAQILAEALAAQDAGEFGDIDGAKAWLASRTP